MTQTTPEQLPSLAEAAQQAAAVLSARHRGDRAGVTALLAGFASDAQMAAGFLLVAELTMGLLEQQTGRSSTDCLQQLCLDLGSVAGGAG